MIILNNGNISTLKQDINYVTFTSDTPMTITPKYTISGQLQYSTNGTNWTNIVSDDTTISANIIYMRGMMDNNSLFDSSGSSNAWSFNNATNLKIDGNLNTLLNYNNQPITLDQYCFAQMFSNCTSLTEIPENLLPATNLANNCYENMFYNCTSIEEIPEDLLPATNLANYCYAGMFLHCTSLTNLPLLPATNLVERCYYQMFNYCTLLIVNTTSTLGYTREFRIPTSGTGTVDANSITYMFSNTGGTMNGTPSINTVYYIKD
jgi:hypothetical protein